jgi:hypothetical protein
MNKAPNLKNSVVPKKVHLKNLGKGYNTPSLFRRQVKPSVEIVTTSSMCTISSGTGAERFDLQDPKHHQNI